MKKNTYCKGAIVIALTMLSSTGCAWNLTGNAGTDPNTNFLGTTDSQPLVIRTNNNEAMRISTSGKVGIGTSSSLPLTVAGHIQLKPNTSGQFMIGRFSDAFPNAYLIARSGANDKTAGMIFRTSDGAGGEWDRMVLSSQGMLGIGTSSPTQSLDVRGTGVTFRHTDGNERAFLDTASGGQSGVVATLGPNGNLNATLINNSANSNHGAMAIYDAAENAKAYMIVDNDGRGFVVADVKSFRVPNTKKSGTDIVYASIEGPEAAAYVRGTASLKGGKAVIKLPEHFTSVASEKDMTVQLTPLSAKSQGLAVVEKSGKGLVVQELRGGKGGYKFDWEVKAKRKGYENFKVIRKHNELVADHSNR